MPENPTAAPAATPADPARTDHGDAIPYHPPDLLPTDNADPDDFIAEDEQDNLADDLAPRPREYDEATLQGAKVERTPLDDDPNLRRKAQAALGLPETPAAADGDPLEAAVHGGEQPGDPPTAENAPQDEPPADYELQPKHLALAAGGLLTVGALIGLLVGLALSPLLTGSKAPALAAATNLPELEKALRGSGSDRDKLQAAVQVARRLGDALNQAQRPRTLLAFSRGNQFDPDAVDSTTHATNQINKAGREVIWVTNAPTNPYVLSALRTRKPHGLSVLIIVGATAPERLLTGALAQGADGNAFSLFRSPLPLEDPTNFLFIDESLYVDLSKTWTTTESVEPDVVNATRDWIKNSLLANATPVVPNVRPVPAGRR